MNGYFGSQYGSDDLQRQGSVGTMDNNAMMGIMGPEGMGGPGMVGSQSLDDIVNQNSKEMRRRSVPVPYGNNTSMSLDPDMRRSTMIEFNGAAQGGVLDAYQFDPAPSGQLRNIGSMPALNRQGSDVRIRRPSMGELALNTQFSNQVPGFSMPPGTGYQSPMNPMAMDLTSPFQNPGVSMMDFQDPNIAMLTNEMNSPMNVYSPAQFAPSPMVTSPMQQNFSVSMRTPIQDSGGGNADRKERFPMPMHRPSKENMRQNSQYGNQSQNQGRDQNHASHGSPPRNNTKTNPNPQHQGQRFHTSPTHPNLEPPPNGRHSGQPYAPGEMSFQPDPMEMDNPNGPWAKPVGSYAGAAVKNRKPPDPTMFKNAYSSTGFDMLGVLMRVATRPNPEINIGSVDLSCAFVVCDAEKDDCPIVYCSENFERLTGYTKHMILGRNCRFLQSPDGHVEAGIKRKYVDDDSVLYLKNMINMQKEAQISLINYRRGGQPFMNLLTMIPITWDSDNIKFIVGFQVDLVEQPNSVTNKNPDGSYSINYQRGLSMPSYVFNSPDVGHSQPEVGQTINRDDVSTVLTTIGQGESELSRRIWDKVLLENTDDVIHVLSLKGLFLYLSPSCRKVLEYEPSELMGTPLSSVCHPSDIVPVTRELKDTASGAGVSIVFRIRRKRSGYMWFEGHGSLHTEQGKGKKCIILVGRERPVYALLKSDISAAGGVGESELWTKMSTSGFFLYVSSNVRQLLDRQPEELVGVSIQSLMRQDSKQEFGRILEIARTGKKASVKHEMINKRGQVLQAFTTIYPGDASEGQKPTFLVTQTRLLKFTRNSTQAQQRPSIYPKNERDSSGSIQSAQSMGINGTPNPHHSNIPQSETSTTPQSGISGSRFVSTDGAAATYAGQDGLPLGRQDVKLASEENVFDELKTTRSTSWQFELRQMEKRNRLLAEEVHALLAAKKKRKRRKGNWQMQKDCANCHTKVTPEWRRGPSGQRDLCNSCGLRWAKQNGRVSPRTSSAQSGASDKGASPRGQVGAGQNPKLPNNTDPAGPSSIPGTLAVADKTKQNPHDNPNSAAAKAARMEVLASQGLTSGGHAPNVPPKIDEVSEEPD